MLLVMSIGSHLLLTDTPFLNAIMSYDRWLALLELIS